MEWDGRGGYQQALCQLRFDKGIVLVTKIVRRKRLLTVFDDAWCLAQFKEDTV